MLVVLLMLGCCAVTSADVLLDQGVGLVTVGHIDRMNLYQ